MIRVSNAQSFNAGLDVFMAAVERDVQDAFRGLVIEAHAYLVENTPQWTGHAASNWKVSLSLSGDGGLEDTTLRDDYLNDEDNFDSSGRPLPKYAVGDDPAVGFATSRVKFPRGPKVYANGVYLVNPAYTQSGWDYVAAMEANPSGYLRPENEGGQMVLKTVWHMNSRFAVVDESVLTFFRGRHV